MSDAAAAGSTSPEPGPGQAAVPEGLVSAVVELVNTGPVLLGAYTLAELTAVDAIVDFLEARPSDEVLAEAVRSLSARQLLVTGADGQSGGQQVRVRGDLGIAVAFQQRARMVLDARATGTAPGEPWRTLVIPQPEHIFLVVRIDALGVHEMVCTRPTRPSTTSSTGCRRAIWLMPTLMKTRAPCFRLRLGPRSSPSPNTPPRDPLRPPGQAAT